MKKELETIFWTDFKIKHESFTYPSISTYGQVKIKIEFPFKKDACAKVKWLVSGSFLLYPCAFYIVGIHLWMCKTACMVKENEGW